MCKRSVRKGSQELRGEGSGRGRGQERECDAGDPTRSSGAHTVLQSRLSLKQGSRALVRPSRLVTEPWERQLPLAGSNSKQRLHCEAGLPADGKMNLLILEGNTAAQHSTPQSCESDLGYQVYPSLQQNTSLQSLFFAHTRAQGLGPQ